MRRWGEVGEETSFLLHSQEGLFFTWFLRTVGYRSMPAASVTDRPVSQTVIGRLLI
jgi:hypothetical protein